jgi:hypothetical protein
MLKYKDIYIFWMTDEEIKNKILEKAAVETSPETQEVLNKPLNNPTGLDEKDVLFLKMLVEKIEKGELNLFRPSSLFNNAVYINLSAENQGKAELDAFNMLAAIRDIYRLWKDNEKDTYQMENLVHRIRVTKERLEEIGGDIFII